MLSVRRTVEPTVQAVTLDQAKAQCRVTDDTDDELLALYMKAATDHAEKITGRAIMPQTLRLSRSFFPGRRAAVGDSSFAAQVWAQCMFNSRPILLPRPPMVAVSSVTYLDPSGTRQTMPEGSYRVTEDAEPGAVTLMPGSYWPAIAWNQPDAVQVTYTAGYDEVPAAIQLGILGLIGHWYENRESVVLTSSPNASTIVPQFVDDLLLSEGAPTEFDYEA